MKPLSLKNLFNKKDMHEINTASLDELAEMLRTDPNKLEQFEKSYAKCALSDELPDNFFQANAKQISNEMEGIPYEGDLSEKINNMVSRIVDELLDGTAVWSYDGKNIREKVFHREITNPVTNAEIQSLPKKYRPELTGTLMKVDISEPSEKALLEHYLLWKKTGNKMHYHMFRQGLDILDVDDITNKIIGTNVNSMGRWLPQIVQAAKQQDFFKIPKTTIVKLPTPILQLTRLDYMSHTRTTLDIVDRFCKEVFDLDENEEYFIKTGTYSSKYDFRNAKVSGAKEVRELGEYLLFIHHQACMMAGPLTYPHPIYGASTTNEWVVREYIQDKENAIHIYEGLPLHTEYRIFVDFDTKEVLGTSPYWEPDLMKRQFSKDFGSSAGIIAPRDIHDYTTFCLANRSLMNRYEKNIDAVKEAVQTLVNDTENMTGQWSVDIMQNGKDFWLIDMAQAYNSALKECIPKEKLKELEEDWIPKLD